MAKKKIEIPAYPTLMKSVQAMRDLLGDVETHSRAYMSDMETFVRTTQEQMVEHMNKKEFRPKVTHKKLGGNGYSISFNDKIYFYKQLPDVDGEEFIPWEVARPDGGKDRTRSKHDALILILSDYFSADPTG